MELPLLIRQAHGVDLTSLDGASSTGGATLDPKLYAQMYEKEDAEGTRDENWVRNKQLLGRLFSSTFLAPWRAAHGRPADILALGVGQAWSERLWHEEGDRVTFHDGHDVWLKKLEAQLPSAKFVVADFEKIELTGSFDFVTLLGVEGCVAREPLAGLFSKVSRWLRPEGQALLYSPTILSWKQIAKEAVKHAIGKYRRTPHIFWGYFRTPRKIAEIAALGGLAHTATYRFDGTADATTLVPISRATPLADTGRIMTFRRNN